MKETTVMKIFKLVLIVGVFYCIVQFYLLKEMVNEKSKKLVQMTQEVEQYKEDLAELNDSITLIQENVDELNLQIETN